MHPTRGSTMPTAMAASRARNHVLAPFRIIRTPGPRPRASAFAERFVDTVRRPCLDGADVHPASARGLYFVSSSVTTTAIGRTEPLTRRHRSRCPQCHHRNRVPCHATAKIGPDRWSHPRIRTGCVRRSHEVLGTSTAERSAAMSSSAMAFTSVVDHVQGPTSELLYCHTDNTGLPHR